MAAFATSAFNFVAEIFIDLARTPFYIHWHLYVIMGVSFVLCQLLNVLGHWFFTRYSASYRALPFLEQKEWQTRIASTLHAVIAFVIALYVVFFDRDHQSNPVFHTSYLPHFIAAVGFGYFVSDFVMIVWYKIPPLTPIILHHVFAGVGMFGIASDLGNGQLFAMMMLLNEGSTPFNNIHWMMMKTRFKNSYLAQLCGYMFTAAWFLVRVAINPYMIYKVISNWDEIVMMGAYTFTVMFTNMSFLMCLNMFWFFYGPFRELVFGPRKPMSKSCSATAGLSSAAALVKLD